MSKLALGKIFVELMGTYAKSFGTEAGKKIANGKGQKPGGLNLDKVKAAEEAVSMIDHHYKWENIDENVARVSDYVIQLTPVVGLTGLAWLTLPVITGATTFAIAGSAASSMVYSITNGAVFVFGVSKTAEKLKCHLEAEKAEGSDSKLQVQKMSPDESDSINITAI